MPRPWLEPFAGRIPRLRFVVLSAGLLLTFAGLFALLDRLAGRPSTLLIYPLFFFAALVLLARRLHDRDRSAGWLAVALVPLLGPAWLAFELCLRRGTSGDNRYGTDPHAAADYHRIA